jgi:hypothetical protein
VSWSPIARSSSAATTDESTPPERPRITRSPPTCPRTRAIASSMMLAGVHSVRQPQISTAKRRSMSAPCGVCVTSGWNWTPYQPRRSSAIAACSTLSVEPTVVNPSGSAVTRSPCDIQTSSCGTRPSQPSASPSNRRHSPRTATRA